MNEAGTVQVKEVSAVHVNDPGIVQENEAGRAWVMDQAWIDMISPSSFIIF